MPENAEHLRSYDPLFLKSHHVHRDDISFPKVWWGVREAVLFIVKGGALL